MERRSMSSSTKKAWGTVCEYVLKEDKEPFVWGGGDRLEKIQQRKKDKKQHKKTNGETAEHQTIFTTTTLHTQLQYMMKKS